ncbi:hypothetical protein NBRC116188_21330 [Oceaniserpentilla sp. 4NH20-0058]|uniref:hypothetical protein n=1 Tax=Oceaniserpentilla sp. 4NH20-0058 TaxID=3127660 RepID=UPI003103D2FC
MKTWLLVLSLFSISVWADDMEEQDVEMSDQQRCEEWAEIDGIGQEDMKGYIQECLSSLNYESGTGDENTADVQ